MKFVTVREFRNNMSAVRKDLDEEKDLVLTANGRPFAVVSGVDPDQVEEHLTAVRRDRALRALHSLQAQSKAAGLDKMTMPEIDQVIAQVRRERRSKSRDSGDRK